MVFSPWVLDFIYPYNNNSGVGDRGTDDHWMRKTRGQYELRAYKTEIKVFDKLIEINEHIDRETTHSMSHCFSQSKRSQLFTVDSLFSQAFCGMHL